MYSVRIRDHIMIAHSLPDKAFGPAQHLHGATYIVDVEFLSENLSAQNIVIDIGLAQSILGEVLSPLRYSNLDDLPQFGNKLTTTEFMAKYIHDRVKERIAPSFNGKLRVTLGESNVAWGGYSETDPL